MRTTDSTITTCSTAEASVDGSQLGYFFMTACFRSSSARPLSSAINSPASGELPTAFAKICRTGVSAMIGHRCGRKDAGNCAVQTVRRTSKLSQPNKTMNTRSFSTMLPQPPGKTPAPGGNDNMSSINARRRDSKCALSVVSCSFHVAYTVTGALSAANGSAVNVTWYRYINDVAAGASAAWTAP